jgi:hypothetical protein
MNKIALLTTLFVTSVNATDIDFMVLSAPASEQVDSGAFIDRGVEYINRMFAYNDLSIKREISNVEYLEVDKPITQLNLEMTSLLSAIYGVDGLTHLKEMGISGKAARKLAKWVKSDQENYKVILAPMAIDTLDCGITYVDAQHRFSIVYMADSGLCANPWVMSHEIGHQDGLQHEGEGEETASGGECNGEPSLMHSGLFGERMAIYGHPNLCPFIAKETPYAHYKKMSDANARKGFVPFKSNKLEKKPVVISELYDGKGTDIKVKLTVYNPHNKVFKGQVRFKNELAPRNMKKEHQAQKLVQIKPSAVGNYEFRIPQEELSLYGSHLKISSQIEWQ